METKGLNKRDVVRFRFAGRDDVPSIVAMLADDVLGSDREETDRQDQGVYLKAFDEMEAQGSNQSPISASFMIGALRFPTASESAARKLKAFYGCFPDG